MYMAISWNLGLSGRVAQYERGLTHSKVSHKVKLFTETSTTYLCLLSTESAQSDQKTVQFTYLVMAEHLLGVRPCSRPWG